MANQVELSKGTEYEFNAAENATLKGLAGSLMALTGAWGLLASGYIIATVKIAMVPKASGFMIFAGLFSGVIALLVALYFFQTRAAVQLAIDTEGYDVTNVMRAMKRLRTLHTVQGVFFIVEAILVVLFLVLSRVG